MREAVSVHCVVRSSLTRSMVYCASASVSVRASASVNWIFILVSTPDKIVNLYGLAVTFHDYGVCTVGHGRVFTIQS